MTKPTHSTTYNPWPHRWAVVLCCAVFPLIWVGALVTTYDAGMAVPDWPGTYGYNMFLYPWQTWVFGPFDLFVEHGHRLLGSLAGVITIGLVVSCFVTQRPRWMKTLALVTLAAVILQGVLGGARVLLDARLIAMLHGCTGPAYFALCAATAVLTSRRWYELESHKPLRDRGLLVSALFAAALSYIQLIFGALLRHTPVDATPGFFRVAVLFHLVTALLVTLQVGLLAWRIFGKERQAWLTLPALVLSALVGVQLILGMSTWVMKYSFPAQLAAFDFAAGYTVIANGLLASLVTTAHVAVGSLIVAISTVLAVRVAGLTPSHAVKVPFEFRSRGLAL